MSTPITAVTDGEKIIQLDSKIDKIDSKVDYVVESLERVIVAFEKLEDTKMTDHESRISRIEKWQSEWAGVYKFIAIIGLILGIISIGAVIFKNVNP